jgi:hypothetical protein
MSFVVAIPSYKRAETLKAKTLPLLARQRIEPKAITVFVADEQEEKEYRAKLARGTYGAIVVGKLGIVHQRNFILDHYPAGERVLSIDDDIMQISYAVNKQLVECHDLIGVAESGFEHCTKVGARLWGMYPVHNAYFMKAKVTYDLKFVIASLCGYINTPGDSPLRVSVAGGKEDVERTCRCYAADGTVVRLNHVAMMQRYRSEPGGLQTEGMRSDADIIAAAHRLVELFPHFCKMNDRKKTGIADVVLRDTRRKG